MQPENENNARWFALMAVGLGTFMTALDASVVNTILPLVSHSFNVTIEAVEWVVTVYLLMLSGLLLTFGRLGDMKGHKRTYLAGFGIFILSSAACGLSTHIWMLVLFRATQALGAAMLAANSPAILTKAFPARQRGQALGLQATMTYLGLTVGPSFGGWLATALNWRWVFYINVPVCALAFWLSVKMIQEDYGEAGTEKFDLAGAFLFLAGLTCLLLGLNQGQAWGWNSAAVLGLIAAAAALLGSFIIIERRAISPMLDLTLFKSPVFLLTTCTAVLNYVCLYSVIFLMPFYLIQGRSLNSAQAGLLLTAQPIIMAIIAPISGTLSDRIGTRLPSALGMGVLSVGMVLMSRLGLSSPDELVVGSLAVVGLGTGIFISPNTSALMGAAPRHRQGIASGILATARNFGMVLGVGLSGAIYTTVVAAHGSSGANLALQAGVQTSFIVSAGVAVVGILTSWIRNA